MEQSQDSPQDPFRVLLEKITPTAIKSMRVEIIKMVNNTVITTRVNLRLN